MTESGRDFAPRLPVREQLDRAGIPERVPELVTPREVLRAGSAAPLPEVFQVPFTERTEVRNLRALTAAESRPDDGLALGQHGREKLAERRPHGKLALPALGLGAGRLHVVCARPLADHLQTPGVTEGVDVRVP